MSTPNFNIVLDFEQILHLCMTHTVWSDPVMRPVSVRSGKFTTCIVTI